jgi:hypothetical protein
VHDFLSESRMMDPRDRGSLEKRTSQNLALPASLHIRTDEEVGDHRVMFVDVL